MSRKNQENVLIIVVDVGVRVGVVRVGVVVDINGVDKMTLFSILGGCQNFVVARFRVFFGIIGSVTDIFAPQVVSAMKSARKTFS